VYIIIVRKIKCAKHAAYETLLIVAGLCVQVQPMSEHGIAIKKSTPNSGISLALYIALFAARN